MPRPPDLMNLVAWLAGLWWAAAAALLVVAFWQPSVEFHWTTDVYLAATVLFSGLSFAAFGFDKRRAGRGGRRVRETTLHALEFLGGWPGSLIGQRTFRHKTWKLTYQGVFWAITAMHLALLAWLVYLWWSPPAGIAPPAEAAAEPLPVIEPATK